MRDTLETIWKQVLEVDVVSEDDDFYVCDGNSLKLIKLFSKIFNTFEIQLDISDYLEEMTFKELVELVEKAEQTQER